ncbi:unnamed protein product [Cylicocyclus nassatus]|uniref:NADP-dependent oxidoreductase domain-containing protein n=1 Tax=Cylicocyclus nassatus TaxID=53992 RepID=A0AA36GY24_CYLNA|nr:unnamed protein product [Cylicocyclus nassatus]
MLSLRHLFRFKKLSPITYCRRFSLNMPISTDIVGGTKELSDENRIPLIGLGTSRIVGQLSFDTSVLAALKAGYRLFDTAERYATEVELGNALEKSLPQVGLKRDDIFIITKVQIIDGNASKWTEESVEGSLKKLKTDYLDMVLVHFPKDYAGKDDAFEINKIGRKEVWRKLEEFKDRGIIKSIGVSSYEVYHLVELFEYAKYRPVMNQFEFHPYYTRPTLVNFCERNGIFVQAFSSLMWGNKEIQQEEIVKQLCKKYGVSPQIILYAFGLNSGVGIIPKSATPSRIQDNLHKVAAISFSESELKAMHDLDRNAAFCSVCYSWKCL